jgi:hypothetical protein
MLTDKNEWNSGGGARTALVEAKLQQDRKLSASALDRRRLSFMDGRIDLLMEEMSPRAPSQPEKCGLIQ